MAENAKKRPQTRAEVAEWLGVTTSTIRNWDSRFRQWIEAEPGVKGDSTPKIYTENDLVVFATIHRLLGDNLTFRQVRERLDDEIAQTTIEPSARRPAVESDEATTALATVRERQLARAIQERDVELAEVAGEMKAVKDERERLAAEVDRLNQALIDAEKRAAAAEAKIEMASQQRRPWWRFGR